MLISRPLSHMAFRSVLKYGSLLALSSLSSALAIVMRLSQLEPKETYLSSTVVTISEAIKLAASALALVFLDRRLAVDRGVPLLGQADVEPTDLPEHRAGYAKQICGNGSKFTALLAPSVLYAITNNLQFVAAAHLDAATYQVAYQSKLVATAILAVIVLRQKITSIRRLAIGFLTIGMCITVSSTTTRESVSGNVEVGLMAVALGSFLSSLAAILVEAAMKPRPYTPTEHADIARNMWLRNCQLSLAGTVISLAVVGLRDWKQAVEHGLFQGYGPLVWLIIFLQSMVGIVVSLVITYADNILKGFATSLSVLLSTLASAMMLNFKVTPFFAAGASLVLLATYQYHAASPA